MRRIILLLFFVYILPSLKAQQGIDAESIAKIYIFLNSTYVKGDKYEPDILKDMDLMLHYSNITGLKLDTLKTFNLESNYMFFSFDVDDDNYGSREAAKNEEGAISIHSIRH